MSNISNKQYNFELNYTPYNFYYSTNQSDLPSDNLCKVLKEEKNDCTDNENVEKCYQNELCNNKDLVNTMYNRRNNHITANKSYQNLHTKYNYALLKTLNLSVGIIGTLVFIYHYNK